MASYQTIREKYTLALHKISAQNRFAARIAAPKALYSFFLDLTLGELNSIH